MQLENIHAGMEFKSFGQLCEACGVPFSKTDTRGRGRVERELRRWINWEKLNGYSLRIVEVYSDPKPKVDERKSSYYPHIAAGLLRAKDSRKYTRLSEQITETKITDYIASLDGTEREVVKLVITKKELWNNVGIAPPSRMERKTTSFHSLDSEFEQRAVSRAKESVLSAIDEKFSVSLNNALESLSKKFLIVYYKGDIILRDSRWQLPTIEEQVLLNEAKIKSLAALQCPSVRIAMITGKFSAYLAGALAVLDSALAITNFTPAYQIAFQPYVLADYIYATLGYHPDAGQSKEELLITLLTSLKNSDIRKEEFYLPAMEEQSKVILAEDKQKMYIQYLM